MKIIRHPVKEKLHQPVVALGTFDGVHIGHKKVIEAAVKGAKKLKTHCAVITFDPHPQEIIAPERGLRLLTTLAEREYIFCGLGVDSVIVAQFSGQMRQMSCREFVEFYLVKKLGVKAVYIGYDYAFGKERSAGPTELKKLGKEFGFSVNCVPPVKVGGTIAKSGKIREALSSGDFSAAIKMLGRPYRLSGKVVKGHGIGKRLGFPTANLEIDERKLIPAQGVYVGFVHGKKCVVNIGSRPTFGGSEAQIEVHILHFNRNIRGKTLEVDLFYRLREEKQFSDAQKLGEQIRKDIARATKM
ncbi:MAG: bifunctional riboflavin kinase/FAD synthetase [bacterium]